MSACNLGYSMNIIESHIHTLETFIPDYENGKEFKRMMEAKDASNKKQLWEAHEKKLLLATKEGHDLVLTIVSALEYVRAFRGFTYHNAIHEAVLKCFIDNKAMASVILSKLLITLATLYYELKDDEAKDKVIKDIYKLFQLCLLTRNAYKEKEAIFASYAGNAKNTMKAVFAAAYQLAEFYETENYLSMEVDS